MLRLNSKWKVGWKIISILLIFHVFFLVPLLMHKYQELRASVSNDLRISSEDDYKFDFNEIFNHDCTRDISIDEIKHTLNKVREAKIISSPFPHVYIHNYYHSRIYNCLMLNLPTQQNSSWMPDLNSERPRKYITFESLSKEIVYSHVQGLVLTGFWSAFAEKLVYNQQLADIFIAKFLPILKFRTGFEKQLKGNYSWTSNLVRDGGPKYYIQPHPDGPNKLVSTLFYLAKDEKKY